MRAPLPRSLATLALPALLGGCGLGLSYVKDDDAFSDLDDTGASGDSGNGADSGDSGSGGGGNGGGDSGEAACPTGGRDYAWVATSLAVGTGTQGLDIDGDGTVDNVLSLAASSLNPSIADALADGAALVVQFWEFDDWCDDASFEGGLIMAVDTDGDPSDNASGETFDGADGIDAAGHALLAAEGSVLDSQYDVWIPDAEVEIGGVLLVAATPIHVQGVATPTDNVGLIGFAVAAADLRPFAEDAGIDPSVVDSLADIDSDGNGTLDALSVGFLFTAASCRVQ